MKLELQSTPVITRINGQQCRVWKGTTGGGLAVTAFICNIAVRSDADCRELEKELAETGVPDELRSLHEVLPPDPPREPRASKPRGPRRRRPG